MSEATTAALVGATGGAGTTRTAVELATALAADGDAVAVIDAAYATQGLADYVPGRLDPDVTKLVTDARDEELAVGLTDLDVDAPGRVTCLPCRAPFERVARAKTAAAARGLEDRIGRAAARFDAVLVDVPPVAANQAVAAVNACERVALVTPATERGADAIQRMAARLDDVGSGVDAVLATRGDLEAADACLPDAAASDPAEAPACLDDDALAAGLVDAADTLFDRKLEGVGAGGLLGSLRQQ